MFNINIKTVATIAMYGVASWLFPMFTVAAFMIFATIKEFAVISMIDSMKQSWSSLSVIRLMQVTNMTFDQFDKLTKSWQIACKIDIAVAISIFAAIVAIKFDWYQASHNVMFAFALVAAAVIVRMIVTPNKIMVLYGTTVATSAMFAIDTLKRLQAMPEISADPEQMQALQKEIDVHSRRVELGTRIIDAA